MSIYSSCFKILNEREERKIEGSISPPFSHCSYFIHSQNEREKRGGKDF